MNATTSNTRSQSGSFRAIPYVISVGDRECVVRVTQVCPIAEVLGFEDEFENVEACDARMIADLLESRMIAPPRPRRRRERAVSSRAMFYTPSDR
jgi:hypothetical protein